jgi:prevent-host-death family protein
MKTVGVREVRQNIGALLDAVMAGEKIVITRRGQPIANLTAVESNKSVKKFPDRSQFRKQFSRAKNSSKDIIRDLRDESGY